MPCFTDFTTHQYLFFLNTYSRTPKNPTRRGNLSKVIFLWICVLMYFYCMCPHTPTICVSSSHYYYYICVLILILLYVSSSHSYYMCPPLTTITIYICPHILLLYVFPHSCYICVLTLTTIPICVRILVGP